MEVKKQDHVLAVVAVKQVEAQGDLNPSLVVVELANEDKSKICSELFQNFLLKIINERNFYH